MRTLPDPIGGEVRRQLGRFGSAGAMAEIVTAWPAAVGPGIAANAWPARVARDGTLLVSTRSSTWAFELTQLGETVRGQLRERLGELTPPGLRFLVGPLPEVGRESATTQERTVPKPTAAQEAEAVRIADEIEDEGLREAVARAVAASLAAAPGAR